MPHRQGKRLLNEIEKFNPDGIIIREISFTQEVLKMGSSHRPLNTITSLKKPLWGQKITYIRTPYGQNQGLWRHFRDTVSPCFGDVFRLLKKVTSGIVPGLKLLLFYSAKRPVYELSQRAFIVYSATPKWSDLRLPSTCCFVQGKFLVSAARHQNS